MKRDKIEKISFIVVIIALCIYLYIQSQLKFELEKKYSETIGSIIDYYELFPSSDYLTYEYFINGKRYKRKINTSIEFPGCADSKYCIGKKFLVRYSPDDPGNSSIFLDVPK